jgi:ribosomal protein S27E
VRPEGGRLGRGGDEEDRAGGRHGSLPADRNSDFGGVKCEQCGGSQCSLTSPGVLLIENCSKTTVHLVTVAANLNHPSKTERLLFI